MKKLYHDHSRIIVPALFTTVNVASTSNQHINTLAPTISFSVTVEKDRSMRKISSRRLTKKDTNQGNQSPYRSSFTASSETTCPALPFLTKGGFTT